MALVIAILPKEESDKDSIQTARKWLKLTEQEFDLISPSSHQLEDYVKSGKIIFTFGEVNSKSLQSPDLNIVKLPSLKDLAKVKENVERRKETSELLISYRDKIEKIKEKLVTKVKVMKDSDLPDFSPKQLIELRNFISELDKKSYVLKAKNGKLVEINEDGTQTVELADFAISFSELCAIRIAQDILGISEVQIVASATKTNVS